VVSTRRKDDNRPGLTEAEVDPNPIRQFRLWLDEALSARLYEPTAMTLATTTPDGWPSARIVLLKDVSEDGFTFFTSYEGRKARELFANPRAALVFYWAELHRQVRVEGTVTRVSPEVSDAYFATRPRGSQLGAWASRQSKVIPSRAILEQHLREVEAEFADRDVPRPPNWGGYLLRPLAIEFWQGRANRLHDRLRYHRGHGEEYSIERLSP
jgi:pyridoxamine 5'-phosphate oxidase